MSNSFIVVMGVSGCGKTTVASELASRLEKGAYLEGDSFHPPENKAKMGAGIPLEDSDRWPWFDALIAEAKTKLAEGETPVLACSALKQAHRDYLFEDFPTYRLIHLEGSFELIKARMDARDHEYMTSDLLRSQFAALEVPEADENLLTLSIEQSPDELVTAAIAWLESNS
ncbi:MAG: gluconokinase [Verrucomicrobiales bacterium]|nr:gluconokinase [Verrucomicrobiales bacterium]